MPRKPCYWTRKLELELVEFVRQKEFIWKPIGNTNHLIQQKYKAYAEFAARLGRGFTGIPLIHYLIIKFYFAITSSARELIFRLNIDKKYLLHCLQAS